jgi:hypothetical protein
MERLSALVQQKIIMRSARAMPREGVITLVAAFGVRLDQAGALRNGSSRRTLSLGLRKGGVYGFG